jgi:hypothetical protein
MILGTPETLQEVGGIAKSEPTPAEDIVVKHNYERYIRARDGGHTKYCKDAVKFDRFYSDDQWEEADLKKLQAEGRPALTINQAKSTINSVLGEQISRRVEVKFKNKKGGSEEVATLLNKVFQSIGDDCGLDYVESQVFSDGLIQDRGYFDVRIGFKENMRGEVEIVSKDPLDIVLDPDAKEYDPSTWGEVFTTGWMSVDDIATTYGAKKAEEISLFASAGSCYKDDSVVYEEKRFGDIPESGGDALGGQSYSSYGEDSRTLRKVRVIDRQYYKLKRCQYFVDPNTGDSKLVPADWGSERAAAFAEQNGLFINDKVERRVRWTVTADKVLLHDAWSPYSTFTIIPYFPYFRRGRPTGMMRGLISPQELLNKVSSQELHIINTTANSGWMVEEGALSGMTTDELKKQGASTGVVLTVARNRMSGIQKIQPNQVPTGLDRIGQKASSNFRIISGVNDAMLGTASAEVSGVALESKKNSGAVQLDVPLNHLHLTRGMVAKKILELVQNFYTEERLLMVSDPIHNDRPDEPVVINKAQEAAGTVMNDITVGEYSVVVSSQPSRDTYGDIQFAELMSLRQIGVQIPDDRVIERSNLENKQDLATEIRQLTGRGDPTPQQQEQQAQQQALVMRKIELELAELEATVHNIQSSTMLNQAKVMGAESGANTRLSELEAKVQLKREEIELRKRLQTVVQLGKLEHAALVSKAKQNQMMLERSLGDTNISGGD